jgi:hypothetical protein
MLPVPHPKLVRGRGTNVAQTLKLVRSITLNSNALDQRFGRQPGDRYGAGRATNSQRELSDRSRFRPLGGDRLVGTNFGSNSGVNLPRQCSMTKEKMQPGDEQRWGRDL